MPKTNVAVLASMYRHPVKGFTPEPVTQVQLNEGRAFPFDRMYAVEDGPAGFDPDTPDHMSKQKFAVLVRDAGIARFRTQYDDESGIFRIGLKDGEETGFDLRTDAERKALADWLSKALEGRFDGPLRVLQAPGDYRFMDSRSGFVSILNLASVSALSDAMQAPVDPLRFRANMHVSGMETWGEDAWAQGDRLRIGEAVLEVIEPTVRCKATHANPQTGVYDMEIAPELVRTFQRRTMGIYARIVESGVVRVSDPVECV